MFLRSSDTPACVHVRVFMTIDKAVLRTIVAKMTEIKTDRKIEQKIGKPAVKGKQERGEILGPLKGMRKELGDRELVATKEGCCSVNMREPESDDALSL